MNKQTSGLPIRYHLEIYEQSFRNDPTVSFESSSPFLALSKGDFVHPGMWDNLVEAPPGTWFVVKDIVHRVWQIDGSHIGHQIGLCIVPKERDE